MLPPNATLTVTKQGIDYIAVRPGLSMTLWYDRPANVIAPAAADVLQRYLRLIAPARISTYLSSNGVWKTATARTLTSTTSAMKSVQVDEYAAFHLGQDPPRNVGEFGVHFNAGPLADAAFPHEDNMLVLEFPEDLLARIDRNTFIDFIADVAATHPFDTGWCGFAFKHLFMSLRQEAFSHIAGLAPRYIAFDISSDRFRLDARHRVCNISWLTLFGKEVLAALGGPDAIRKALPEAELRPAGTGLLVVTSEWPAVGDVNRGATDVGALRALAALTRPLRPVVANLGPDDEDFAQRWLSRFD